MIGERSSVDYSDLILDASDTLRLTWQLEKVCIVESEYDSEFKFDFTESVKLESDSGSSASSELGDSGVDDLDATVLSQSSFSFSFESTVSAKLDLMNENHVDFLKKDGRIRVCVDFRDLNKASPKDDFSLLHIDELVDFTIGHALFLFMDGFSGYNKISMAPKDIEKTTFNSQWGTYCY
ncbi:uncharacterized protein LOC114286963 [Camellia sinensis]|uniref:uncharacterized protein LOC114286963 n=1 Tax=Camellia sinensis TaxID=4442 RepID=UPI001036B01A|nr:uncharacterized protein LOC114286963 [Camellia sinensis]